MVLDTSALLAVFFNEAKGTKVARIMEANMTNLCMSTVNLAEVLILLQDRQPVEFKKLRSQILGSSIRFVAPDAAQAEIAAEARLRFPLNLGDCFAYALSKSDDLPLLTLDRDFKQTDAKLFDI